MAGHAKLVPRSIDGRQITCHVIYFEMRVATKCDAPAQKG
jgi:hypothetical protein